MDEPLPLQPTPLPSSYQPNVASAASTPASAALRSPLVLLLAALALGVLADRWFVDRWVGVSAPLFVLLGLAFLLWRAWAEGRPPTRANLWMGAAALLFAGLIAVRDTPTLVFLNVVAVVGLLLMQVAHFHGPSWVRLPALRLLLEPLVATFRVVIDAAPLSVSVARTLPSQKDKVRRAAPVLRGLLLAAPVLLCFGALLVSADSVFASYVNQIFRFEIPFDFGNLVWHSILALVAAWFCAGGMHAALQNEPDPLPKTSLPAEGDTQRLQSTEQPWRFLGWVEALTVLVLVDLLFGTFMLIQGAYFFGGMDTLDRTGMTFADYARRGFFELLTVACLTLGLLWCLALLIKRVSSRQQRAFNIASGVMVVLVIGMLASAFQRMLLYEQAYGFTELRVYTHTFMIWLALVLVLSMVALLRDRPGLFLSSGLISALIYLAVLNLANPEARIVQANVARYQQTGKLDAYYLASLSADAAPDLVRSLEALKPEDHEILRSALYLRQVRTVEAMNAYGWPAWRLARWRALSALESLP